MDPYQVLGISRSASDDEIKKAYRALSRKYHPDANMNNPNKAFAEEKFKQVQQAYDLVMKERQRGGSYGSSYSNFSGGFRGNANSVAPELQAASNYLRTGHYKEAMTALLNMEESMRNGTWYYLAAVASEGMGNLVNAKDFIQRAIALEPSNGAYRQFQQHLETGGAWYATQGSAYDSPFAGSSSWCLNLALMNLCCFCC